MNNGRGLNAFTLGLLIFLGAVGIFWFASAVRTARRKSNRAFCISHLKLIGALCISRADDQDGVFPYDPSPTPSALNAFQVLVDESDDFNTRLLCSPAHFDTPAVPSSSGSYVLGASNVSYAYRGAATAVDSRSSTILASNDTYLGAPNEGEQPEGHEGGVNVLMVTGEAYFLPLDQLASGRNFPEGLVDNYGSTK